MGEVGMEVDVEVGTTEERKQNKNEEKDGSSEVVRWEKFLPRMVLRVLLVEADDSTRQIIAALLRKCSYKVVAAVPDGLMAWEILKDRPHTIDLILTEVELPSISGFALLTLVMEHDICKNIPVIMMSSQDSITMVLKCMLKGAADFLIKPVRRNELRNLWQHVWRRHMLAGGRVPHSLPATEHEATAENSAESNESSDYGSSTQKVTERSDTQVLSQLKCTSANLSNTSGEQQGNVVKMGQELLQNEGQVEENSTRLVKVKEVARCSEACESNESKLEENPPFFEGMNYDGAVGLQSNRGNANVMIRVGCNDELVEPSTGAIDLIGSFDNRPKGTFAFSGLNDGVVNKFEFSPQLELSLRRSCSSSTKNQRTSERPTLNHSNASAFSWYDNSKSLQPVFPTLAGNRAALKEVDSKSGQDLKSNNNTSQPHVLALSDCRENLTTPVTGQSEAMFPSTQLGLIPVPGVRMDMYAGCNNVFPHVYHSQSDLPPEWSPKPAGQREYSPFPVSTSVHSNPDVHDSEQGYHRSDEATNCSIDQTLREQNKQEPVGELRCSSPIADQSACSSLCNDVANKEKSSTHGGVSSRSNASASATFAPAVDKGTTTESFNDSNFFVHDGLKGLDTHRSSQREAALTKFRLKRKDRCFEKKVRYQSRKRLAEQRPRVKGQFVRQVQNDTPVADADGLEI
ncbi:hypothetical protein REPUB_Repub17cG0137300 [Reevesia pubescens]